MTILQEIQAGTAHAPMTVRDMYALTEAGVFRNDDHYELIDGEIVPMAAAKASWHERMKSRLNRALARGLPNDAGLFVESSITLDGATLVEPDITVLAADAMTEEMRGPDIALLIEVADSSIAYDLRVKAPLYARYGVRDYWVVDAVRQTVRTHRDPVDGAYREVREYRAEQPVAPLLFPDLVIRLDQLD